MQGPVSGELILFSVIFFKLSARLSSLLSVCIDEDHDVVAVLELLNQVFSVLLRARWVWYIANAGYWTSDRSQSTTAHAKFLALLGSRGELIAVCQIDPTRR